MEGDPAVLSPKCVAMILNFFGTVLHLKMGMIPPNHLTCSLWGSNRIPNVRWKPKASVRFNMVSGFCISKEVLSCLSILHLLSQIRKNCSGGVADLCGSHQLAQRQHVPSENGHADTTGLPTRSRRSVEGRKERKGKEEKKKKQRKTVCFW